jgi:septum formation inhibitor MinC
MDKVDALIFIDANQYLDFYQLNRGRKLLDSLMEQQKYIFVTTQVVDEVERNKLEVAERCLTERFEQLKKGIALPDYLFDVSKDSAARLRKKLNDTSQAIKALRKTVIQTLEQISRSEDRVSKALAGLFSTAIPHTSEEIECATDRKERGNPPGKKENPLGDELTWE